MQGSAHFYLFFLLQTGLFSFLLLPFSHVFSDSQPPTLRSPGTVGDDFVIRCCSLMTQVSLAVWFQQGDGIRPLGNGLSCTHRKEACSKWPKSLEVSKQSSAFSSGLQNVSCCSTAAPWPSSSGQVASSVWNRHLFPMTSSVCALSLMLSLAWPSLVHMCLLCEAATSRSRSVSFSALLRGVSLSHMSSL